MKSTSIKYTTAAKAVAENAQVNSLRQRQLKCLAEQKFSTKSVNPLVNSSISKRKDESELKQSEVTPDQLRKINASILEGLKQNSPPKKGKPVVQKELTEAEINEIQNTFY